MFRELCSTRVENKASVESKFVAVERHEGTSIHVDDGRNWSEILSAINDDAEDGRPQTHTHTEAKNLRRALRV